jgi:hypothetical protein
MPSTRPELLFLYFLFLQERKLQYGIRSRQNVEVDYSYSILIQHHSAFFVRNNKVNVIIMFYVINIVYVYFPVPFNVQGVTLSFRIFLISYPCNRPWRPIGL